MSRQWIVAGTLSLALVAAVGCQQAEEAAADAGDAVDQHAGDVADKVDNVVDDADAMTDDAVADAKGAVDQLEGEAREAADNVMSELEAKQAELADLKDKIASTSAADLLAGEGKAMVEKAESLTSEIDGLKAKLHELIGSEEH